jgi:hypothetical protein
LSNLPGLDDRNLLEQSTYRKAQVGILGGPDNGRKAKYFLSCGWFEREKLYWPDSRLAD